MELELIKERYELAKERICGLALAEESELGKENFGAYFATVAKFLMQIDETHRFLEQGGL
jgi:hypothetical protein